LNCKPKIDKWGLPEQISNCIILETRKSRLNMDVITQPLLLLL